MEGRAQSGLSNLARIDKFRHLHMHTIIRIGRIRLCPTHHSAMAVNVQTKITFTSARRCPSSVPWTLFRLPAPHSVYRYTPARRRSYPIRYQHIACTQKGLYLASVILGGQCYNMFIWVSRHFNYPSATGTLCWWLQPVKLPLPSGYSTCCCPIIAREPCVPGHGAT